jgi:GTPase SAR1 family protein
MTDAQGPAVSDDRTLSISLYENLRAPPVRASLTVSELLGNLCEFQVCADKQGAPAWSPITYRGAARLASEALAVCALVYDLDQATDADMLRLWERLAARGWIYGLHETWTAGRWRLCLPLASDLTPAAYPRAWELIRADLEVPADPSGRDLARLFFVPSHAPGEARAATTGGDTLCDFEGFLYPPVRNTVSPISANTISSMDDTSKPLKSQGTPNPSGQVAAVSGPETNTQKFFDLENFRREVARITDVEKRRLARGFVDSTLVIKKGTRDETLHLLASVLPMVGDTPIDLPVAMTLLEPVLASMENADEEGLDYWRQKFQGSLERGLEFRRRRDAEVAQTRAFFRPAEEGGRVTDEWKARLVLAKGDVPQAHTANAELILHHEPDFAGYVRFNELRRAIEITGGALAKCPAETQDIAVSNWLVRSPYKMNLSRSDCGAALLHEALQHPRNPLRDYFARLEWDGVPRVHRLLTGYCGAEGHERYLETISRKFFIGATARALNPGCQMDTCLVLHGPQGVGKTSLVRVLGGEFATETKVDVHSKDAVMITSSSWLVELSELASVRQGDIEPVRAFLTVKVDRIRLPYAKVVGEYPRRCAFVGTTNDAQALSDVDGNRRFWVASVKTVDLKGLERDRDQLWAEAKHLYEAGHQWWLTPEEQRTSDAENRVYQNENPIEQHVEEWVARQKVLVVSLTTFEVATQVLNMLPAQVTEPVLRNIGRSMKQMGWLRTKTMRAGKSVNAYRAPLPGELGCANISGMGGE